MSETEDKATKATVNGLKIVSFVSLRLAHPASRLRSNVRGMTAVEYIANNVRIARFFRYCTCLKDVLLSTDERSGA
jgi:hypothetical protein